MMRPALVTSAAREVRIFILAPVGDRSHRTAGVPPVAINRDKAPIIGSRFARCQFANFMLQCNKSSADSSKTTRRHPRFEVWRLGRVPGTQGNAARLLKVAGGGRYGITTANRCSARWRRG